MISAWVAIISLGVLHGADVRSLIQELKSNNELARMRAAESLADLGEEAGPAAAALGDALTDDKAGVRYAALLALGRCGAAAKPALPQLRALLAGKDEGVRQEALKILAGLGPDAAAAAPDLKELLAHKVDLTRALAAYAAIKIKPDDVALSAAAFAVSLKLLGSSSAQAGETASDALSELGADSRQKFEQTLTATAPSGTSEKTLDAVKSGGAKLAAKPLVAMLDSKEPAVRARIARLIGVIGPDATAVGPLVSLLNDSSPAVRSAALGALARAKVAGTTTVEAISKLAADPDAGVRRSALEAVQTVDPNGERAHAALFAALHDKDHRIQADALVTLAKLGRTTAPGAVEALGDEKTRYTAAVLVGDLGPQAAATVPDLIRALKAEKNAPVRRELLLALAGIGAPAKAAVPDLIQSLKDPSPGVQAGAALALGRIGAAAKPALNALYDCCKTAAPKSFTSVAAAWAMVQIQPDEVRVVVLAEPRLREALTNSSPRVRAEAALTLGLLGAPGAAAAPDLIARLNDPSAQVRHAALVALGLVGLPDEGVSAVAARLKDDDVEVQRGATFTLGRTGPKAKAALAAVEKNLQGADVFLRLMSAWAAAQIEPRDPAVQERCLTVVGELIRDQRPEIRNEAVAVLASWGRSDDQVRNVLKPALADPNQIVRHAADEAMKRMNQAK